MAKLPDSIVPAPVGGARRPPQIWSALAIASAVVVACMLVVGTFLYIPTRLQYPAPPTGWTTFDHAEAAVQSAVVPRGVESWNLTFAEGAAANDAAAG